MKDEIRELAANLYAIVVCAQSDEGRILDAMETMTNALTDKVCYTSLKLLKHKLICYTGS